MDQEVITVTSLTRDERAADVMELLAAGIPLTLLLDLVDGPHSQDLLLSESPSAA
jgi:hypothetical protein